MHQAGLSTDRITAITGHRNNDSLKHYIEGPSQSQKNQSSTILHNYGNPNKKENEIATISRKIDEEETLESIENIPERAIVPRNVEQIAEASIVPLNPGNINFPGMSGIGSLFAGAQIASGANITINFNSGHYSNQK